jgi:Ni,Fe-hydrogenase I large subunit
MDQKFTREDTKHAWYDEPGGLHPFDRTTLPTRNNTVDMAGKYSWATAVRHRGKRPPRGRPAGTADGRRRQARRVLAAP